MNYVEILRMTRAVATCTVWLVLILALNIVLWETAHGKIEAGFRLPIAVVWGFAGFVSCIFASVIGASLAAENDGHLPVAWTKPCSRLAYASAKMAVDLGAIAIVYALACAAVFIYLWAIGLGRELYAPSDAVGQFVRFLIAPAAFYGLLQALTATLSRGAGAVLGFTWVGLIALEALATLPLPAAYHAIFNFINNANPLVYISFDVDSHGSIIMVGLAAATTALALIAATGGAAAIYRWQRMEA